MDRTADIQWFRAQAATDLRDQFAASALQGWLAGPCQGDTLDDYDQNDPSWAQHQAAVARACYGYADAMLAEREKRTVSEVKPW